MMSMISLFYRDVEHGSWQGLDGVGGGESGDCGWSPARRGPAIRRLKKSPCQIYCYRKRTPKVLYIFPKNGISLKFLKKKNVWKITKLILQSRRQIMTLWGLYWCKKTRMESKVIWRKTWRIENKQGGWGRVDTGRNRGCFINPARQAHGWQRWAG